LETGVWVYAVFWVVAFGVVGYMLGPRKGYDPMGGAGIGALFGIFGVLFLLLKGDVARPEPLTPRQPVVAPPPQLDPIRTRTYREGTAETTALRFQADAAEAAKAGYLPSSQAWDGATLTVVYQAREQAAPETPPPTTTTPATSSGIYVPAATVGIGGALVVIGSLMPWVRVGMVTGSGMEGDGLFTLAAGAGLVLVGLAGVTDPERASRLRGIAAIPGLIALVLAGWHIFDISNTTVTVLGTTMDRAVGEGLYVIGVGAVIAIIGAVRTQPEAPVPVVFSPERLVEVYAGPTTEASAREFAADAEDMLDEGYEPASQVWQGTSLTVTYRRLR
jgi:hypothetical protein